MKSYDLLVVFLVLLSADSVSRDKTPNHTLGRKIDSFQLQDYRGKTHSLDDLDDQQLVVVYFLGTECPLAKLYGPRIEKLYQQFQAEGVAVLGISSNSQDSITELAAHARSHELTFPILKDVYD